MTEIQPLNYKTRTGWLINDCLTCIPGTKTLWHDLLETLPELIDKTNGYTDFSVLAEKIEYELAFKKPNYIIRNASYFRKLNTSIPQISLLQDLNVNKTQQIDICRSSKFTVVNSEYVRNNYSQLDNIHVIPLGIDSNIFCPGPAIPDLVHPNSILYIGSSSNYPKGFDIIIDLINKTDYNFCLVMKDDFKLNHPNVKVYNKINHNLLINIIRSCKVGLCTSLVETEHLAGIEMMSCGLPMVTSNVGIYWEWNNSGPWGLKVFDSNWTGALHYAMEQTFSPREFILKKKLDKKDCMAGWRKLINLLEV